MTNLFLSLRPCAFLNSFRFWRSCLSFWLILGSVESWAESSTKMGAAFQGACADFNGDWSGDCVYRSAQYGHLSGEIEMKFQHQGCEEIRLNGQVMKIPGQFKDVSSEADSVNTLRIFLRWTGSMKEILSYDYEMLTDRGGRPVDEVLLKGFFTRSGTKLIMEQEGTVDKDPVQIRCEMRKSGAS